jgi:hypothetical protein
VSTSSLIHILYHICCEIYPIWCIRLAPSLLPFIKPFPWLIIHLQLFQLELGTLGNSVIWMLSIFVMCKHPVRVYNRESFRTIYLWENAQKARSLIKRKNLMWRWQTIIQTIIQIASIFPMHSKCNSEERILLIHVLCNSTYHEFGPSHLEYSDENGKWPVICVSYWDNI